MRSPSHTSASSIGRLRAWPTRNFRPKCPGLAMPTRGLPTASLQASTSAKFCGIIAQSQATSPSPCLNWTPSRRRKLLVASNSTSCRRRKVTRGNQDLPDSGGESPHDFRGPTPDPPLLLGDHVDLFWSSKRSGGRSKILCTGNLIGKDFLHELHRILPRTPGKNSLCHGDSDPMVARGVYQV